MLTTKCECGRTIHSRSGVRVCARCQGLQPIIATVDPNVIPRWVSVITRLRRPSDTGVGDTVARLLGRFGERFKSWSQKLGIPCGCTRRQKEWNERWPYDRPTG